MRVHTLRDTPTLDIEASEEGEGETQNSQWFRQIRRTPNAAV